MFSVFTTSQFARHVATLVSGQAAAQIITIIMTPFIARLFVPEDFGVAALFISIVTILSVPATFRFELAVLLPEKDNNAIMLIILSFFIVIFSCMLVLSVVTLMQMMNLVPAWLIPMEMWVWLIPVALFFIASIKIVEGWLTRKKKYKIMAVTDVGQALTTTGSRMVFGLLAGTSVWGLLFGYVAGLIFKFIAQFRYVFTTVSEVKCEFDKSKLVDIGKQYSDFPVYNMPSGLIRTFAQNIPVIMFGVYFGPAIVGLYAMANRLFRMPVNILSRAIRRVYLQKLTELKNAGYCLRPSYLKMTFWLALFTVMPTFFLWVVGSDLLVLFLGDNWLEAGRFLEILVPWLFTIIVATPATAIIVVCRKQHIWLRYNIIVTIIQFSGFIIAHHFWANAEYALIIFVATGIFANIYIMLYGYRVISENDILIKLAKQAS